METSLIIKTLDEMDQFAEIISKFVFPGAVIGLMGELGSGKTTFTKFLAKHMNILDTVSSPTFTILKIYPGKLPLYHMDVYRLEGIGYDYELDDFIYGEGVSVIEWYAYIREMLPEEMLEIQISGSFDYDRFITVKGSGAYEKCIQALGH